jgi:hypothetical protein
LPFNDGVVLTTGSSHVTISTIPSAFIVSPVFRLQMAEIVLVLTDTGRTGEALLLFGAPDDSILLTVTELQGTIDSDLDEVNTLVIACCNLTETACERIAWLTRSNESLSIIAVDCIWAATPPSLINVFTHILSTTIEAYAAAASILGPSRVTLMRKLQPDAVSEQPLVVVALRAPSKTEAGIRKDTLLEDLSVRIVLASCGNCQVLVLGESSQRFVNRLLQGGSADKVGIKKAVCIPIWQPARFADIAPAIACADGLVCTDSLASTAAAILRVPTIAVGNANSASYLRSSHISSQSMSHARTWMQAGQGTLTATTRTIMRLQQAGSYLALVLTLSRFSPNTSVLIDPRGRLDLDGVHRSGWQFALSGLRYVDIASHRQLNPVMFDTYLDRTFDGTMPTAYTLPWTGFLHHPFDTPTVTNTVKALISKEAFISSLPHCKCLFTMSSSLAQQVSTWLEQSSTTTVPLVVVVKHPTQLYDVPQFSMDIWRAAVNGGTSCVVQIGAWLRVSDAVAQLQTQHVKTILCAPHTEVMCRPGSDHAYSDPNISGVTILETMSDVEYDALLSSNIVFLRLHDAVAVNTILECIARNTPIIVNRLPAVEEYLGADYPGLYEDDGTDTWISQASALVNSDTALQSMTDHLSAMDKSPFSLNAFVQQVQTTLSTM